MSKFLKPDEIDKKFDEDLKKEIDDADSSGIGEALRNLSKAVHNLKSSGLDISVELTKSPNTMVFSMYGTPSTVPIGGVFNINGLEYAFGMATKENDKECLTLAISYHDIRFHHTGNVRHEKINLVSEDAYQRLQINLIDKAASIAAANHYDVRGVFNTEKDRPVIKSAKKVIDRAPLSFARKAPSS